jgi:hypothetical protein
VTKTEFPAEAKKKLIVCQLLFKVDFDWSKEKRQRSSRIQTPHRNNAYMEGK